MQIVVVRRPTVALVELVLIVVTLRSFISLAPGVGRETDGAVRQRLGTANNRVDSECARNISQGLRDYCEPV